MLEEPCGIKTGRCEVTKGSFLMLFTLAATNVVVGCGPSPAATPAEAPSGTLVIVIRQGPERVSFHPKVARIQRANQQIASILGHSLQIELDGALLPQTHDGAEDVIARLVEDLARDLDGLAKEDKRLIPYAREHFERLSVRYSPTEAAAREAEPHGRRRNAARLDLESKTIDVARREASWLALDRGEISSVIYRAFSAKQDDRYGNVLPDQLAANEHRAWFQYHAHEAHNDRPQGTIGSVHPIRVRGMVVLASTSTSKDGDLAKEARAYLIDHVLDNFSTTYQHQQAEVENAPPGSPFRQSEAAFIGFLRAELPKMSIDERGKVAAHLWIHDFRKDHGDRDRFATYAFPGIDRMQFSFETIDQWIAAGHPSTQSAPQAFDVVVSPAIRETRKDGQLHFTHPGRGDGVFYQWVFANRAREDAFVHGLNQRGNDDAFVMTTFYNARRVLREESEYLRFLRRFEASPSIWAVGADVHREVVYRPSAALLEESRRLWREVPHAKGRVLLWFARHGDGSYHPDEDWPDLVQGTPADDVVLDKYLSLGWEAFELLPAAWLGVAKTSGRVRVMTKHATALLSGQDIQARPGGKGVAGTMATVARLLCEDKRTDEVAELRAYAQAELPRRPGSGLSDVIEATDPANCKPRRIPLSERLKSPAANKPPTRHVPPKKQSGQHTTDERQ